MIVVQQSILVTNSNDLVTIVSKTSWAGAHNKHKTLHYDETYDKLNWSIHPFN